MFSASVGFAVSEVTVRKFKREIDQQLRKGKEMENIVIPARKHGQPLLLPEEIDELTKKFVLSLCHCGSVSSSIVLAAAKGIVTLKACSLLKEHGGPVELTKAWAISFLSRHGYVKRKVTRISRKVPDDFENVKAS